MRKLIYILSLIIVACAAGCIEDGFSSSSAHQPSFSTDTLDMGVIFTDQPSTTSRFVVYNHADKGITVSSVSLSGPGADFFRLNVDGFTGREFSDVEIRANDSVFVLVETTLPENGLDVPVAVEASLDFVTQGVTRSVTLVATGRDAVRLRGRVFDSDTVLGPGRPYQIFDSLVVAQGATLTIEPGAELCFHDGAELLVRGNLRSEGTSDRPVVLCGDRTGDVVSGISFDLMSRQWDGVVFYPTSRDNYMSHTCVRNTWLGVILWGDGSGTSLTMVNSQLRNSGATALWADHADVSAYGCEFAEAAEGVVVLNGGKHVFNHCTFANNYLFSAVSGPLLALSHLSAESADDTGLPFASADISNSIFYGYGGDVSPGDLTGTGVVLRNCLLRSDGSDDDNFVACLWGADPLFYTVRNEYIFDYRLRDESPAIGAASPALTAPEAAVDAYGLQRGSSPDLGAYVYTPAVE